MYIELKNVSKKIKGIDILDDVSLRMESGKIYGFRGKNGSGKTMLMRAIAGLIKVTGTVDINGSLLGKDEMFPPSIGILIENPSFISNYTGFEPTSGQYGPRLLNLPETGTERICLRPAPKEGSPPPLAVHTAKEGRQETEIQSRLWASA